MSSIIEGYNYDIFISYRQKDNKGERWVSEFVQALKTELESTFKEDISIYFDENPHDGLLETHDVDASLKEKLKCLIFIPVISRTFCDPKAFAWQHEFLSFIEQASDDKFGLKVTLPNGNVATRVLPVRIHELGPEDTQLCEEALGTALRGVDFIYKAPGVNRPLRHEEDHPKDNLNKTYYRDQINKVANAIDEIIQSIKNPPKVNHGGPKTVYKSKNHKIPGDTHRFKTWISLTRNKIGAIILSLLLLLIILESYRFLKSQFSNKNLGVMAFTNPVNDEVLSNIAIGYFDQIITMLNKVNGISVNQRYLTFQYLNKTPDLDKLRREFKFNYLVEMNISGNPGNLKIWVGLAKAKGKKQIWSENYLVDEKELVSIFSSIVQNIARELNVEYSNEDILEAKRDLSDNPEAFVSYLAGNARLFRAMGNQYVDSTSFLSAIEMYDKAIETDPDFALAYAKRAIARSWGYYTGLINSSHIEKCWSDINTSARLNKDLPDLQIAYGFYYYYCTMDFYNALIYFHTASIMDPENYQPLFYMALVYRRIGEWEKSKELIHKVIKLNPQESLYLTNIGLSYTYMHKFDSAIIYHQKAIEANPEWIAPYLNKIQSLILKDGNTTEAWNVLGSAEKRTGSSLREYRILLSIYDRKYEEALIEAQKSDFSDSQNKGSRYLMLANIYYLLNNNLQSERQYDSALVYLKIDYSLDSTNAAIHSALGIAYAAIGDTVKAIQEGKKSIELSIKNQNKMEERDLLINLAQIYRMTGQTENAVKIIGDLLENPSCFSINMMRLDPDWTSMFSNKEFKNLYLKYSGN